ncbi:MAG: permease, partial [Acidobacteria bacterium]
MSELRRRLRFLFRRDRFDGELEDEMRSHMEMRLEQNLESGMPADEARRAALRQFGNFTLLKEVSLEMWTFRSIEIFVQDLRYGLRMMRRNPGFTAVAVLSLALGIGANVAIFSLINAVLIRRLPVPNPDQLVLVRARHKGELRYISYPMYRDLAGGQHVFEGLLATSGQGRRRVEIAGAHRQLEQVRTARVSANYFSVLGVTAQYGRTFAAPSEEQAAPEAVISDSFWERQFGRAPTAVGESLRMMIGNAPDVVERVFTIVGVAPREFFGETAGDAPEVWIPIAHSISREMLERRNGSFIQVMGRLRPGSPESQARAGFDVLYQQLLAGEVAAFGARSIVRPEHRASDYRIELENAARGLDVLRRQYSRPLAVLMASVVVVLAIACSNLANLLMARSTARSKEIGVRLALGAGRARLVRQLLTESLLLALAGGALGILVAGFGSRLLVGMIESRPGALALDVAPDSRVLAFALALSVATALVFGLAPALRGSAVDPLSHLK